MNEKYWPPAPRSSQVFPDPETRLPATSEPRTMSLFFERPLRTRGYETDASRAIPLAVFLEYLENLRWECLLDPAFHIVDFIRSGHFFVVRDQRVQIVRRVGMGEDLALRLHFEHIGRSLARVRHDVVRVRDGALVAQARVTGAFLGPTRRPARIPDRFREVARAMIHVASDLPPDAAAPPTAELSESTPPAHRRAPSQHATSWLDPVEDAHPATDLVETIPDAVPSDVAHRERLVIRPSDNDIFSHVNAATYLRLFEDARLRAARAEAFGTASHALARRSVRIAIHHHREVRAADEVEIAVWQLDDDPLALGFVLLDPAGQPSCFARVAVEPPRLNQF